MKKIITFIMIAAAGLFASCGDILDIYPVSNNSADNFFKNDLEIRQGLMGVYARLARNGGDDFPTMQYLLISESRSDNWYINRPANAQRDQMDLRNYQVSPTTTLVNNAFSRLYALIASANTLLSKLPEDDKYLRVAAEARFLRAYGYFELVRTWGPVPVVLDPIEKTDAPAYGREPASQVYEQIVRDLEFAITNLGANFYTGAEAGRVGTWAARTLLAYVYVTMAGYPVNDATAYAKAVSTLSPVINDLSVRFAPTYPQIFSINEENTWDLFSVQFQSGGLNLGSTLVGYSTGGGGSQQTIFPEWVYSSYVLQGQDLQMDSLYVRPLRDAGDTRMLDPILTEFFWTIPNPPANPTAEQLATQRGRRPFLLTKYLVHDNTNTSIKAWNDYPLNCPVLRVSDAYLLYAEALVGTNKADLAKPWVDAVRTRAGVSALAADPTMADIFDERRREFMGEGKRYFDLVRQGETVFVNTLKAFSDQYRHVTDYNATAPTVKDMLLPIPQPVMNVHTDWEQNPGY